MKFTNSQKKSIKISLYNTFIHTIVLYFPTTFTLRVTLCHLYALKSIITLTLKSFRGKEKWGNSAELLRRGRFLSIAYLTLWKINTAATFCLELNSHILFQTELQILGDVYHDQIFFQSITQCASFLKTTNIN